MSSPRRISALLQRAGFVRSDFHRRDVTRHTATTGFRVWRTRSQSAPGVPLVAVAHFDWGQHGNNVSEDVARKLWVQHVRAAQWMLGEYAAAIEAEGYKVGRNFAAEDPYLIVQQASLPGQSGT